ncbi:MAG: aminotransferase class I/II-fold pyridoxal phosphate-dependent enzyme [Cytophagales bacterium]|uniref:methionine aminotransferase n=1 Tax=Cyclobacterium marinum TaxID=104 RepID=UPI0030DD24E1|nr:aminotransferase class I/II-fold pyridoxal phosphate-dependent enzyme [Cytophagales bacterium]|tara:strand:+ start:12844 stop:14001 length:1158 start_codon:yes stop_codon:yes gene_type:complete
MMTKAKNLPSKLPYVGTTIFTVMSKLATDEGAYNLSQGFPSFDCSPKLSELVCHYLKNGYNQYAPMSGAPVFRESIAEKTADVYGISYNPETEVTVTSGATEAIFCAVTAVVYPGDEVIVLEPAYDSYVPAIDLNGGVPVFVTLDAPDFKIDWEKVKAKISPKTKAILINTPHNPVGTVFSKEDLDCLAEIIRGKDIYIISDEVYEHIVFDGEVHHSMMTHPELKERSFICNSVGKTYHVTGWKIGYCLAPAALTKEFRRIHQYITFCTVSPMQFALADFLKLPEHYEALSDFYQRKRDRFNEALKASRFTFKPSKGSFFQIVSYEKITDKYDYDLAIRLTKEIKVASVPVSVFYKDKKDDKLLRFCFAKDDDILDKAAELLCKL